MTTRWDVWKIYYEHWAMDANLVRKLQYEKQCAKRIQDTISVLFEDVMEVVSSQDTKEEKIDVFSEIVLSDPYAYIESLEDVADVLLHGGVRTNRGVGCKNFSHLMSAMNQDVVMDIFWAHDIWDIALSELMNEEITNEELDLLHAVRSADSIVGLF